MLCRIGLRLGLASPGGGHVCRIGLSPGGPGRLAALGNCCAHELLLIRASEEAWPRVMSCTLLKVVGGALGQTSPGLALMRRRMASSLARLAASASVMGRIRSRSAASAAFRAAAASAAFRAAPTNVSTVSVPLPSASKVCHPVDGMASCLVSLSTPRAPLAPADQQPGRACQVVAATPG